MNVLYSPLTLSWIYTALFALFFLVCIRAHGNFKFVGSLFRDLVEVRERHNVFDDTVREKSFLGILVLLTCCSGGILLQQMGGLLPVAEAPLSFRWPHLSGLPGAIGCSLLAGCYFCFEWLAYSVVGYVFSDRVHTWMWVRGFTAGMGLAAIFLFPLAIVSLAYPQSSPFIALLAFFLFILVKIAFIFKGFRIFFTESSSWVVFLYYLCSLEIAPLIITLGVAHALAG